MFIRTSAVIPRSVRLCILHHSGSSLSLPHQPRRQQRLCSDSANVLSHPCFQGLRLSACQRDAGLPIALVPLLFYVVILQHQLPHPHPMTHLQTARMRTTLRRCTGTGGRIQAQFMYHGMHISQAWRRAYPAQKHSHPHLACCLRPLTGHLLYMLEGAPSLMIISRSIND